MRRLLGIAMLALLVLPPSALGAARYSSPGGGEANPCAKAAPCSLGYAITAAAAGDEVVVTPGTYSVAKAIEATVPLKIHGVAGESRPRIVAATGATAIRLLAVGTAVSDLTFEGTEAGSGVLEAAKAGDVLDHLEVRTSGKGTRGLVGVDGWTLTDSLVVADGDQAAAFYEIGFEGGTSTMRNDTLIAAGEKSVGLAVLGYGKEPSVVTATDVVVDASSASQSGTFFGAGAPVTFDHSDLHGKEEGEITSTNAVTSPPLFVDAAGGDFREAPDSPTIDSGINDPANGATDLDGNARSLPGRLNCTSVDPPAVTDIGAYEFVPIVPPCAPQVVPPSGKSTTSPAMPPETTLSKAKIRRHSATFTFSSPAAAVKVFECKLDAKPWEACLSPHSYGHLNPGRHAFRVRAQDAAGEDPTPAFRHFKIHGPRRAGHRSHRGVTK